MKKKRIINFAAFLAMLLLTHMSFAATWYVRSGGNDTNDGTAADAGHAWATPLPGCVGGAHQASSGDTIDCQAAQTIALAGNVATLPDGVNLRGLDATTIITGTAYSFSVSNFPIPIIVPGNGSTISYLKVSSTATNRSGIGYVYITANATAAAGNSFGSATPPAAFTVDHVTVDLSGVTGSNNMPCIFLAFDADQGTDAALITGVELPPMTGTLTNCTFLSKGQCVKIYAFYQQTDGDEVVHGQHIPLPYTLNVSDCTITSNNPAGTGVSSSGWNTSAITNIDGQINLYRCTISATDAVNTAATGGTPLGSAAGGGTKALYCGSFGKINAFGCTLSTSRPQQPGGGAFDVNVTTAKTGTTASITVVGCTYDNTKTAGPNITDVVVFPAASNVKSGTGSYGPTGAETTPTLTVVKPTHSMHPWLP